MLVEVYKARRRPKWQDTRPKQKELRDAYAIAARNQGKFSSAFRSLVRSLITPDIEKKLLKSLREGAPEEAVNTIPWYNPADPESVKLWDRMSEKLKKAYSDIIEETGNAEYSRLKVPIKIEKVKRVPIVPINPYSIEWIKRHSADLLAETSTSMKEAVRQIVLRNFEQGKRAELILPDIMQRIGLLEREERAVQNRLNTMLGEGIPPERAGVLADRYSEQLLKKRADRIARTETITAESQGRRDSWRAAIDDGKLPSNVIRQWVAVPSSPVTCEICDELHGKTARLGEPYFSEVLGRAVDGPGSSSHVNCRCSEILIREEA